MPTRLCGFTCHPLRSADRSCGCRPLPKHRSARRTLHSIHSPQRRLSARFRAERRHPRRRPCHHRACHRCRRDPLDNPRIHQETAPRNHSFHTETHRRMCFRWLRFQPPSRRPRSRTSLTSLSPCCWLSRRAARCTTRRPHTGQGALLSERERERESKTQTQKKKHKIHAAVQRVIVKRRGRKQPGPKPPRRFTRMQQAAGGTLNPACATAARDGPASPSLPSVKWRRSSSRPSVPPRCGWPGRRASGC